MMPENVADAIDRAIADLRHPQSQRRLAAIRSLRADAGPRAVDALCAALGSVYAGVRLQAILALRRIGDPRALLPLVQLMLATNQWKEYRECALTLQRYAGASIPALIASLEHWPDRGDRVAEYFVALAGAYPPAAAELIAALQGAALPAQCAIARALGRIGAVAAVPALVVLLQGCAIEGQTAPCARAATGALQRIGHLQSYLYDVVEADARDMLLNMSDETIGALQLMLGAIRIPLVSETACDIQFPTSCRQALDSLSVRAKARIWLGAQQASYAEIVGILRAWLAQAPRDGKIAAAVTLPWYSALHAADALETLARQPDPLVQSAAQWALTALGDIQRGLEQERAALSAGN